MKLWVYAISLFSIVFLLSACGTGKSGAEEEVEETEQESEAVSSTEAVHVELINTAGEKVGIAQLTPVVDGGGEIGRASCREREEMGGEAGAVKREGGEGERGAEG